MLSTNNVKELQENQYQFILGARIKNETTSVKNKIFATSLKDNEFAVIDKSENVKLIIAYSDKRAKKDEHNVEKAAELTHNISNGNHTARISALHKNCPKNG